MNIYLLSNQECSGVDNIICVSTDITQIKKSLCDNFCNGGKPQLDIWKNEKKISSTSGMRVVNKILEIINP